MDEQRKFYKARIVVEIISDRQVDFDNLADVEYEITVGHSSGQWSIGPWKELTREQARKGLEKQGTDPSFLLEGENDE